MNNSNSEFVNVRKIFKEKNPKLSRLIPGFVYQFIERLIHQQEVNEILDEGKNITGLPFAKFTLQKMGVTVTCVGVENIPRQGGVILASNHPLGGLDGMAFLEAVSYARTDMKCIVNDILMKLPNFGDVFVPVNKVGTTTREALQLVDDTFAQEQAVLVFPAGLCSRKIKGQIVDIEWQKSFITKAVKYKRPVVPVYISGQNSNRFYRISKWRKFFGIKANLEMMTLADEMFKQKGKTLTIYFGEPIDYTTFTKDVKDVTWAQYVRAYVYELTKQSLEPFITFITKVKQIN
jgi:putative hemolysin